MNENKRFERLNKEQLKEVYDQLTVVHQYLKVQLEGIEEELGILYKRIEGEL